MHDAREGTAPHTGNWSEMDGRKRSDIQPGLHVEVVLKADQSSGRRTRGVVKDILTNSGTHPHGIKVRLADGQVGRVIVILAEGIGAG